MEFDSETQKLTCHQCGNSMDVQSYENTEGTADTKETADAEETADAAGNHTKGNPETNKNMKIYHCQSCGAELLADEYTSATICSFCGNPSLVEDRLSGDFKPETVIPFKISKEQAVKIYKNWVKKGPLTPSELSTQSTIEKISGLYAPFWLYDYAGEARMTANAQRVRTQRRGDTEYTYTDHFHVYRDVTAEFEKIPADASEKMPDDAMDKLEPFNYDEIEPFAMPYLSGFLSERYNYSAKDMESRARTRADDYITNLARNTIKGYTTVQVLNNDISMDNVHNEYALFPVWMLNCRYKNKDFQFMLNGQTGKIVADRPISKGKAFAWGIGIFIVTLIITMIGGLVIL
jgi:DNA-directed RNA polymerase subunit RPC12/RpoP